MVYNISLIYDIIYHTPVKQRSDMEVGVFIVPALVRLRVRVSGFEIPT